MPAASRPRKSETPHRLSPQPGKVVTQGLIPSQTKADVEPFARFIPLLVLQVAMKAAPECHSLGVYDSLNGQIWRWGKRGSGGGKIDGHPHTLSQALPAM